MEDRTLEELYTDYKERSQRFLDVDREIEAIENELETTNLHYRCLRQERGRLSTILDDIEADIQWKGGIIG